ncbi:MAG: ornithine cyclodeaminase family protein, partial [Gemmatimonadota bacterium]
ADMFARDMGQKLGIPVRAAAQLATATVASQIIVTCTPAKQHFLGPKQVRPGAFVAAVGADNPEKQEIDPALMGQSTVVVDNLDQCRTVGDLHHAIVAGVMSAEQVAADLGAVVAGKHPGRSTREEIIVFDSTGTALQDAAAAAIVYKRALERPESKKVQLGI